jgi:hypothetical protein
MYLTQNELEALRALRRTVQFFNHEKTLLDNAFDKICFPDQIVVVDGDYETLCTQPLSYETTWLCDSCNQPVIKRTIATKQCGSCIAKTPADEVHDKVASPIIFDKEN